MSPVQTRHDIRASFADAIVKNGYAEIPEDPEWLPIRFTIVCEGMVTITEEPQLAALFPWRTLARDAYGDGYEQEVGLVFRHDREHKWVFHYTEDARFEDMVPSDLPDEVPMFLSVLRDLNRAAMENALFIARALDEMNASKGLYAGSLERRLWGGRAITRVLRYLTAADGESDAYPHTDRGIFTNHWGATHTGLYVYRPDKSRERVNETSDDSIAFFTGRKIGAVTRGALGFGTPHGVRYSRKGVRDDRYSVVTFVHPKSSADDAAWLHAHAEEIKTLERSLKL